VITLSVNEQVRFHSSKSNTPEGDTMGTTTSIESQRALAWIVRQLKWERTLEVLRTQGPAVSEERVAA